MTYAFEPSGKLKEPTAAELAAADTKSSVIVHDSGTLEDGSPYWLYIAVKPSRYKEFMRLTQARQPIRFDEYGAILRYGFEPEVPLAIKDEMKQRYGCDDDFMAIVAAEVKQAQGLFLQKQEAARINDIVAMLKAKNS